MKILKIFGIVVGIHVFALILIFANPGCNSTTKPPPSPSDTVITPAPAPAASAANPPSVYSSVTDSVSSAPPVMFHADAPAAGGPRNAPTRPGTPVAATAMAEPVNDVTQVSTYTVKSGDNLWTIARKNNLTVAQLAGANNLQPNTNLRPGQKLMVPVKPVATEAAPAPKAPAPAKPAEAATGAAARASSEGMKHTVKPGDTLGEIARKYGVKQRDLAVANNLSDPGKLKPGMELTIPGWKATGTTGKSTAKTPAPKSTPAPAATVTEPAPVVEPTPAPSTLPPVPVIRLDDSPASTPKQP